MLIRAIDSCHYYLGIPQYYRARDSQRSRFSVEEIKMKNQKWRTQKCPSDLGILIILLGQSGAGKSHFINSAAGQNIAPVCRHSPTSEKRVQGYVVDNPNINEVGNPRSKVILVDTPGHDDVELSGISVVNNVGAWLNNNFNDHAMVAGIIFIYDISEDPTNAHANVDAWPIERFTSPALIQHIVLTTGKWDLDVVKENQRRYIEREQVLKEMPAWRRLLDRGVSLSRYEGNHDTAWETIDKLLEMYALRVKLVRREFTSVPTKIYRMPSPSPEPIALMRLARVFSELRLNFESLTITRTAGQESRRKVTAVATGNLEILSGAQNVQVETVTVTSAARDFVTQNTTMHNYHFHGPVTVLVGSDAAATRLLHGPG